MRTGAYPGSFNPPTTAHLAIARAAMEQRRLTRVDLIVSRRALDKEHVERPLLEHRIAVLEEMARPRPWLGVVVTEHQLLVDMAEGHDVLVVGADKYEQLHDAGYYGSARARDLALRRLPELAVVTRPPHLAPAEHALHVPPECHEVSSTAARGGNRGWMTREARAFDDVTGAWSDPERYEEWVRDGGTWDVTPR